MRCFVSGLLYCTLAGHAAAHNHILYECTDVHGGKQFTNVPADPKTCRVLSVGPVNAPPTGSAPAPAGSKPQTKAPQIATPATFPRVDSEVQQSRDNDRRRILEQELGSEQKLLDQAKKELAEQESMRLGSERNYQRVLDRLEPFQKRVRLHEDNLANLRKEISKIR